MPVTPPFCINKAVVDMLHEHMDLVTGDRLRQALQKAIRNIIPLKFPILTRTDALSIKGVGDYIASLIEAFLNENPPFPDGLPQSLLHAQMQAASSPSTSRARSRGRGRGRGARSSMLGRRHLTRSETVPSLLLDSNNDAPHVLQAEQETFSNDAATSPSRVGKKPRTYVPRVKSAPAALLMALLDGLDEDIESFEKSQLATRAQEYFLEPMIKKRSGDQSSWHDGWTSMNKQLVSKGLVDKRGSPPLFGLTEKGIEIAKLCRRRHLEVEKRTVSQYNAETHNTPSAIPPAINSSNKVSDNDIVCVPVSSRSSPRTSPNFRRGSAGNASIRNSLNMRSQLSGPQRSTRDFEQFSNMHSENRASQEQSDRFVALQMHQKFAQEDQPTTGLRMRPSPADVIPSLAASLNETVGQKRTFSRNAINRMNASQELCGLSLLRKYNAGEEFGTISDGKMPAVGSNIRSSTPAPPVNRPGSSNHSSPHQATKRRRKISPAQCDRAVRVIERLEKNGNSRQDLIMIADVMLAEGKFPRDDDALFKAMSDTLWAVQQAESKAQNKGSRPLELQISSLGDMTDNQVREDYPSRNENAEHVRKKSADWEHLLYDSELEESGVPSQPRTKTNLEPETRAHNRERESVIDLVQSETIEASPSADSKLPTAAPEKATENCPLIVLDDSASSVDIELVDMNGSPLKEPKKELPMSHSCVRSPDRIQSDPGNKHSSSKDSVDIVVLSDDDSGTNCYKETPSVTRPIDLSQGPDSARYPSIRTEPAENKGEDCQKSQVLPRDSKQSLVRVNEANTNAVPKRPRATDSRQVSQCDGIEIGRAQGSIKDIAGAELPLNTRFQGGRDKDGTCQIILILDSAERIAPNMVQSYSSFVDMLKVHEIPYDVRQLPCGDTLFVARFDDGTEILMDYLIERKTVNDYGASMSDGRISKQSYMLRNSHIFNTILILEGDLKDNSYVYNQPRMHSTLAELEVCENVYVKKTKDLQDTVHFYSCIRRRLQARFCGSNKTQVLNGRHLFSEWLRNMKHTKRSMTLEQVFMLQLCHFPDLGMAKARTIMSMGYKTPQLLHKAYEQKRTTIEKENMLNPPGSRIGSNVSKAVAQVFTLSSYGL